MSVGVAFVGVGLAAEFDVGDILQIEDFTVGQSRDDDLSELLGGHQTALVFHRVLERVVRVLAQRTRGRFDVLLGQHAGNVRRDEFVLGHHVGLQPDAHRVVGTQRESLADALNTQDARFDVDLGVVREERLVVGVVGTVQREDLHHGGLTLHGRNADLRYGRRQLTGGGGYFVLHVHGRHVGIGALTEIDRDAGRTYGGAGCEVGHVLHAVDGLFEGDDDRFLDGFGAGARIAGVHHDRRRRDVGILLHGQRGQADDAGDDDDDGDDRRKDGAFDEMFECHVLFLLFGLGRVRSGGGLCGCGLCALDLHGRAFAHQTDAFGEDRFARGETRGYYVFAAVRGAQHVDHGRFGDAVHDFINENLVLRFERGRLRDDDLVFQFARDQHVAHAAAVKQPVGVGEYGAQLDAARRGVDHAAD